MSAIAIEPSATRETTASVRFLETVFGAAALANVSFLLPDGTCWPDARPRAATLTLKSPGALRSMFGAGTEKGLAEAYLRDDFDISGNIESAFELADALAARETAGWRSALQALRDLWQLPAPDNRRSGPWLGRQFLQKNRKLQHSPESDQRAVSFHYDLSNDFFRLWLDPEMLYSCAYFEQADWAIETAQEAKMRHICRKLRLGSGQRLLDIGCGWGGLALFAARHYGVHVTGVTLSRRQAEFAIARVREAGLTGAVTIELKDYRELSAAETFDAIVSVGMSEHVGAGELANYFQRASELLKPGGVFLNHAIGEGVRQSVRTGPSFIDEYVFPDSEIPPIPAVLTAAETAGFEVRDVENLREHYALTLRHWVRRLESAHPQALAFVDEATYRVWRLYLAGSAYGFAHGRLAVYQALLAKSDAAGDSHLPLTRRDWYAEGD